MKPKYRFLRRRTRDNELFECKYYRPKNLKELEEVELMEINEFVRRHHEYDAFKVVQFIYGNSDEARDLCFEDKDGTRYFQEEKLLRYLKKTHLFLAKKKRKIKRDLI